MYLYKQQINNHVNYVCPSKIYFLYGTLDCEAVECIANFGLEPFL